MFLRLLFESFRRQRRRKLLAGIAIFLGTSAVTAMLALATTIGDRIHAELAVYGANIVVLPKADTLDVKIAGLTIKPATGNAFLHESDLAKLHTIFWANNITVISPELHRTIQLSGAPSFPEPHPGKGGVSFAEANDRFPPVPLTRVEGIGYWFNHPSAKSTTGVIQLHPTWKIEGNWPTRISGTRPCAGLCPIGEVAVGHALAATFRIRPGASIGIDRRLFTVVGVASTGTELDNELFFTLTDLQALANLPDAISRIEIAATTRPEDAFARQDPATLSPAKHEIWYCRPYANSIAYQIQEAIPNSTAQQIRRVEQSEGNVLARISGLMWLIAAAALLAAGFAVSAAMATAVLERRREIGLMRSLGASRTTVALLFYAESALLALATGALGFLAGSTLAHTLGAHIFPAAAQTPTPTFNPVLLPIILALALSVALLGGTPSIRRALLTDPSTVLRSDT